MKKILTLIVLMALITFSALSACGTKTGEQNTEKEDEKVEYRDFDGQVFKHSSPGWTLFWPEEALTVENDRIRAKSKAVQEALNVVLEEERYGDETVNTYQSLLAISDYSISWASQYGTPNPIYGMWKAGYLQSWNDIPEIDLLNADLWGSKQKQLPMTFGGELWAYVGKGNEGGGYGRLLFNNEYIKEFGASSPQELHEQKKWTWETFEEMIKTCKEDSADRKIYGLSCYNDTQMLPLSAIFSNGGQIVKYNDSNAPYFGLLDPEALQALEWVKNLRSDKSVVFDDKWPPINFSQGGATFFLTRSWVGTSSDGQSDLFVLDNLTDFGWIPFPYGPAAEYGKTSGSYDSECGGVVMLFGQDKEEMGYVFSTFQQWEIDDGGTDEHELWKRKTFFTEESYQNYMDGCTNFNFDYFAQLDTAYPKMVEAFRKISSGSNSASEAMQGIKEAMDAMITANIAEKPAE